MKQLTPMDSHFYYFESPDQPMMIGSLWLCDQTTAPGGLVRHKEILQYIEDRLNRTSYFRRRLEQAPFGLDDPYWLDDPNFDLEYHVRHVGLPQPGDWRQLCIFTARTMSRSVDMRRAPWEVYIIEGLNNVEGVPPGSFAVLIRFHHAYVDGKASVELSEALMETTANHEYGRQDRVVVAERAPSRLEMWARTTPRMLGQSFRSMKAGLTFSRKSLELLKRLRTDAMPEQKRVPRSIFNTDVSPHRSYGAYEWNIKDLKSVRQLSPGTSINDVIIAIIGGGMRRYLQQRNALPELSLVSMCPVSVRPEEAKKDCGNLVSAMYIGVGTDIEDPVERLRAVHRRTTKGIPLAREVLNELSFSAGEMVPPYMRSMGAWLQNKARLGSKVPVTNMLITNVPGIPGMTPQYFAGALIRKVFPMVPIVDGMAITHGITGIYDKLAVGVLADRGVLPDMDVYIRCLQESTEEYLQRARLLDQANRMMHEAEAAAPVKTGELLPAPKRKAAASKRSGTSARRVKAVAAEAGAGQVEGAASVAGEAKVAAAAVKAD